MARGFIGNQYGPAPVPSTARPASLSGMFSMDDQYYIRQNADGNDTHQSSHASYAYVTLYIIYVLHTITQNTQKTHTDTRACLSLRDVMM